MATVKFKDSTLTLLGNEVAVEVDVRGMDGREITQLIDHTLRAMFAELRERHRKRLRVRR